MEQSGLCGEMCEGLFLSSVFCFISPYVCFMPVSCCFDYCSFVMLSEVWESYTSCFVIFFLKDCFGNSGSFRRSRIYIRSINFRLILVLRKTQGYFDTYCTKYIDCFGQHGHFNRFNFCNSRAWNIFSFL